ncbi:MAG: (2Fe-2S)-binding protein [Myxococcota bacterium]|jgi:carbon-monoxide dehydrogenase small subunit|nr:(2Fe-2S)-binding protein [Myxococcota bacterium]
MATRLTLSFTLNGAVRSFETDPNERLLDLLRREGLKGAKAGCREGVCGACTVLLDSRAVYSCLLPVCLADGHRVTTVEGIGDQADPHPIQKALVDAGAVQCGFCIPGIVVSAKALLDESARPDDEEICEKMDGNLCRCTGYEKTFAAIKAVLAARQSLDDEGASHG